MDKIWLLLVKLQGEDQNSLCLIGSRVLSYWEVTDACADLMGVVNPLAREILNHINVQDNLRWLLTPNQEPQTRTLV